MAISLLERRFFLILEQEKDDQGIAVREFKASMSKSTESEKTEASPFRVNGHCNGLNESLYFRVQHAEFDISGVCLHRVFCGNDRRP